VAGWHITGESYFDINESVLSLCCFVHEEAAVLWSERILRCMACGKFGKVVGARARAGCTCAEDGGRKGAELFIYLVLCFSGLGGFQEERGAHKAWADSKMIRSVEYIMLGRIDLDNHALVLFTLEFPTEIFKSDLHVTSLFHP
jgi:hypothetical protein